MAVDLDKATEIIQKNDYWDAKRKLENLCDDKLPSVLWELDKTGQVDLSAEPKWLSELDDAPKDAFSAADLAGLIKRFSKRPKCGGLGGGRREQPGWDRSLSRMMDMIPDDLANPIVDVWKAGIPEPMSGAMAYALAHRGWIGASELDDSVLAETATQVASRPNWHHTLEANAKLWPPDVLGPAYVKAAAAPNAEIWDRRFLQGMEAYATPEQKARILLNVDYADVVKHIVDWVDQAPDGVVEQLLLAFDSHETGADKGKAAAAIFLGRHGAATTHHIAAGMSQVEDKFAAELALAMRGVDGVEELMLNVLNEDFVASSQYLLIPGCPTQAVLKAVFNRVSKWPRSAPWERTLWSKPWPSCLLKQQNTWWTCLS